MTIEKSAELIAQARQSLPGTEAIKNSDTLEIQLGDEGFPTKLKMVISREKPEGAILTITDDLELSGEQIEALNGREIFISL